MSTDNYSLSSIGKIVSEPINCLSEEEDFIYIAPFHSSRLQFIYTPTHTLSKIQVRYVLSLKGSHRWNITKCKG